MLKKTRYQIGILAALLLVSVSAGLFMYRQNRNLRVRIAVTVGATTGVIDAHLGAAAARIEQVQAGAQPPLALRDAVYELRIAQRLLSTVERLQASMAVNMGDSLSLAQSDLADMSSLPSIGTAQADALKSISAVVEALRGCLPHPKELGPDTTEIQWNQEANQKAVKAAVDYMNSRYKR